MLHKKNTLPKAERLHSDKRIEALFAGGRRGSVGPVRFCRLDRPAGEGEEAGVSVLFSVPKKVFKKAWKRNLLKRRMRESYRLRKHELAAAAAAAGQRIDLALICFPAVAGGGAKGAGGVAKAAGGGAKKGDRQSSGKSAVCGKSGPTAQSARSAVSAPEIPDFKTIDNAIGKIIEKFLARG